MVDRRSRVALVTGASRGVDRMARNFAVALNDYNVAELAGEYGFTDTDQG